LAWLCWALTAGQICFWLSVISWKLKLYRKICQASTRFLKIAKFWFIETIFQPIVLLKKKLFKINKWFD
jgi:hypothetical protein